MPALAVACLALAGLLVGGIAVDPIGALRSLNVLRLDAAGARVETFRGADGSRLRVFELGPLSAETPVLLVHGLGAAADYWTDTALALARSGRTVLLPDMPGSGSSDPPASLDGYSLPGRVAALDSLLSALGLSKVDLVGHSLGGWTAAAYAIREPHRVKRLVLVDSGGFTVPQRSGEAQRLAVTPTDRPGARRLLDLLFFRKPFPPMGLLLDAVGRSYRSPNVVETVARLSESDGLLGRESELPHGTVLIWGERETLFPLADARRTAARIPGARLLVVRGVGHDGPMEAPRVFQRALSAALSGERLGAADR